MHQLNNNLQYIGITCNFVLTIVTFLGIFHHETVKTQVANMKVRLCSSRIAGPIVRKLKCTE
jgi:hypothetical protein